MKPYYQIPDGSAALYMGDCLEVLPALKADGLSAPSAWYSPTRPTASASASGTRPWTGPRTSPPSGAFRADLGPAAGELGRILALPEAERPAAARALLARIDGLLPDDPALAAALAEEMAGAFADGAGEGSDELRVTSDERAAENALGAEGLSNDEARRIWEDAMGEEVENG